MIVRNVPTLALWPKRFNTRLIQNYDYEVQTSYTSDFFLFSRHYVYICYCFDQKTGLRLLVTFIFNND